MRTLITLYRALHRWLFDVEHTRVQWVEVQTTQGVVHAWILVKVEERERL